MNITSMQTIYNLIRKEFDAIDLRTDFNNEYAQRLINTVRDIGFKNKALEMENDLNA